jgi:hypothetical protein
MKGYDSKTTQESPQDRLFHVSHPMVWSHGEAWGRHIECDLVLLLSTGTLNGVIRLYYYSFIAILVQYTTKCWTARMCQARRLITTQ